MIETERLILRPYTEGDAAALVSNANRPEVARMLESISLPFTETGAVARIEARQCDASRFTFAVQERTTNDVIGEIGAGGTPNPRLGYFLRPESWGKGYASEAIAAALGHAFETLCWPMMDADCFDDNPASIRTLEKAGFVRVGSSDCRSKAREGVDATSLFRLTRTHWATPVLKTARLTLRPYRTTDVDRLVELLDDIEVSRMLSPVAHPFTRELADAWITGSRWNADDIQFALDDGTGLIGGMGFNTGEDAPPMLGFWLGHRYWGNGLMSEAVLAMIDWTFANRGYASLRSNAFVDNHGSQRIHEKAGFVAGETVQHFSAARGEPIDAISYTLNRTDWQARR